MIANNPQRARIVGGIIRPEKAEGTFPQGTCQSLKEGIADFQTKPAPAMAAGFLMRGVRVADKRYGVSKDYIEEYETRNNVSGVAGVYTRQKAAARKRGIEWKLSFSDWLDLWDGKIAQRGVKRGQLVMCRIGDMGPYSKTNVRIDSVYWNAIDRKVRGLYRKKPRAMSSSYLYQDEPYQSVHTLMREYH